MRGAGVNIYIIIGTAVAAFVAGWQVQQWRWDASLTAASFAKYSALVKRDVIKEKVVTKYVDRVREVEVKTQETVYVARNVPSGNCPSLPAGFVELHDASAEGRTPDAARIIDAAPAHVTPAQSAEVVAFNYGQFHKAVAQIVGLQEYINKVCTGAPGN